MKKIFMVSAIAAVAIVAVLAGVAQAQKGKQVIYASSEKGTYKAGPTGGTSMQAVWGDMGHGAHGTFTKFVPGLMRGCTRIRTTSPSW
jgi:opacity protein-like surface antigen